MQRWRLRWSFLKRLAILPTSPSLERQRPAGCWSEMATDDDDDDDDDRRDDGR